MDKEVVSLNENNKGLLIIDEETKNIDEEAILFVCLRRFDKKYE